MDTKTTYLWTVICPKELTLAHNVFEVTELCRTRADILKPSLDRTLVVSQITKIQARNQDFMWGVLTKRKWTKLPKCIF